MKVRKLQRTVGRWWLGGSEVEEHYQQITCQEPYLKRKLESVNSMKEEKICILSLYSQISYSCVYIYIYEYI